MLSEEGFERMIDITITLALLWIGWELHRIAQLGVNFVRGYEKGAEEKPAEQGK